MPFKHILLPLDSSTLAEEAVTHAITLARSSGADIHLLHVQKSPSHSDEHCTDPVEWRLRRAELRSYLKNLSEQITGQNIRVTLSIVEGRPAEQIVEYCEEKNIDLIVITAYGKGGISRFDFGSTAQQVFSGSGRSFMVVRPAGAPPDEEETAYRRILVSMDGSPRSEWVACQVASMMRGQKVEIILLQVIAIPEMPRRMPITQEEHATREKFVECNRRAAEAYLDEVARQLRNGIKVTPKLLVAQNVAERIYATAAKEQVDLIAMSAHDWQSGAQQVTGTLCHTVMCQSNLPVLVFQDLPEAQLQGLRLGSNICEIRHPTLSNDSSAHQ
ncbi:universal stress protein [Microbulbifer hydrolyticus]|uniref:Nucleotide-binding universal stress UspA family protein n=1 Tax=Microbulbifer hydrolyticus TaxID=48074 RepID=A0A6P1T8K3_9GAMM|nr:universal stress protein [Microbulbifer hydrolyticus]MBB5210401.1 nucleotide-binding universal stress UspA family protein [Microbulbifer hydrolyticus]QHQ39114.1 universal stress protein [Microbulbifer hydrolyticus]